MNPVPLHPGLMRQQTQRAKADQLRKGHNYEEAASEYAALWPSADPWTGWGYAFCLRKLNRSHEALQAARAVHELSPDFLFGRSLYAWCLFDVHIRRAEKPDPDVLAAAQLVVDLTGSDQERHRPTSPFVRTVLQVARAWASSRRDLRAVDWLGKLDPEQLQTTSFAWKDEEGRERQLWSQRERYYGILTRSLERLGRWQECLETATRALTTCGGPLHYDNDVWFARRIARAKLNLGNASDALVELQQLLARKPTAFLHTDIADAAFRLNDLALTFKHALEASLTARDIGFVLRSVQLIGEVLWHRDQKESARKHISLCIAVRSARGWKAAPELTERAAAWNANGPDMQVDTLLRELRQLWKGWRDDLTPRQSGRIVKMLSNGRAGFIRAEGNEQFYFDSRDLTDRRWKAADGARVTFVTRAGFDRKRQRSTIVACEVSAAPPRPPNRGQS